MTQSAGAPHRPRSRTVPLALVTAIGSTALVAGPAAAAPQESMSPVSEHASRHALPRAQQAPATVQAVLAAPARATVQSTYRVRAGDTVSHIALRTGVSISALVAANALGSDAFIREGQTLVVPEAGSGASATSTTSAPAASSYTVRRGDTVSQIAARAGTTSSAIIEANGLASNGFLREGQSLSLPGTGTQGGSAPSAPAAPSGSTYTVRSGDTLSHIAVRAGTSVSALRAANPSLDSAGSLQIGQRVTVPGASSTTPVPSTFLGRTYPDATVRSAQANKDVLASRSVPSRAQMQSLVADTATRYGVDPALAQAIAFQESGFDMRAVSPANAVGVMQVIPSSGEWTSEMAGRRLDLLDPQDNVTSGVLLLRAHTSSGADQATVIAAYYQGMSSVRNNGLYSDTRRYVANVQTLMGRY